MAKRVLIFGARGWIGGLYKEFFQNHGWDVYPSRTDVADYGGVAAAIIDVSPDLVVNCAGKTHSYLVPNIDGCVADPRSCRNTLRSNALGAGIVASVCAESNIKLVHLSSGCIFDGDGVFDEDSIPNPVSWYAKTKVLGEELVLGANPNAIIMRIRMPIHQLPHPRNLVTKLAGASQVVDVVNSVTVVDDLLALTLDCLAQDARGIVHAVHEKPILYREFIDWYRELVDPAVNPEFIPMNNYKTLDGRSNCVLAMMRTDVPKMKRSAFTAVRETMKLYALNLKQDEVLRG